MREMGAFEAKNRLGAILDMVEGGEEVIITRRGKPVARVMSMLATRPSDRTAAMQAAERIMARSQTMCLGGLSIKELIEEGRP